MSKKSGIVKKTVAALLLCGSLFSQSLSAWASLPPVSESVTALAATLDTDPATLLSDETMLPVGDAVSDWLAFFLGRTGEKEMAGAYLERLRTYVTEKYKEEGALDPITATSWHRLILTVAALGENPAAFGEDAEGNPVNLVEDGCFRFYAAESFDLQGLNAWLYALLSADSYCYLEPEDAKYTREKILGKLVEAQEPDGGFGLVPGGSDVDITAMVLQALAPYQHNTVQYPDRDSFLVTVAEVTEKALAWLSAEQQEDGGFLSGGVANSESCAQVILALSDLGINASEDERFIKNGRSVADALESFLQEDGTYSHDAEGGSDFMATQQAVFAAFSIEQLQNGQRRIYDLRQEPLDQALALELKLQGMADEEVAEKAEELQKEYETVAPEDRSYVYSFGKVMKALQEKGIAFDEETAEFYSLNEAVPVTASAEGMVQKKTSTGLYAGIAAVILAAGAGAVVLSGKGKKAKKNNKKVHW